MVGPRVLRPMQASKFTPPLYVALKHSEHGNQEKKADSASPESGHQVTAGSAGPSKAYFALLHNIISIL